MESDASAACHAVFATAELAEAIFLELPMRDILVNVQRSSKQWKAIVDASMKLQTALLFQPITAKTLVFNPAKYTIPMLEDNDQDIYEHPLVSPHSRCFRYDIPEVRNRPQASWRRQLLTQPPLHLVSVLRLGGPNIIEARNGAGVRLGDVAIPFEGSSVTDVGYKGWGSWVSLDWTKKPVSEWMAAARQGPGEGPWEPV